MKKTLMLMLFIVLALGLVAPAFAVHPSEPSEQVPMIGKAKIELGGSLRFRGEFKSDVITSYDIDSDYGTVDTSLTEHSAAYDGRVRLHMNAYVTDNTMGRVQLESPSGNSDISDTYAWGCNPGEAKGTYGEGNCKKGDLRVLEAWIQHQGSGLLGVPAALKVGHMPLMLGRGLFFNHSKFGDDAIAVNVKPNDNLILDLLTTKFDEGESAEADDDADAYIAIVGFKNNMLNASLDVTYVNDKDFINEAGFTAIEQQDGTTTLWNIGVRGDVKVDVANIYADVEIQTGKVPLSDISGASMDDLKFRGYAFVVGASAKLADVGLNAEFGLGSGQDEENDWDNNKYAEFVTALSGVQNFTYVYDYRMATAAMAGKKSTGIANTTYAKLGANAKPMPDLSVEGALYWLKATEDKVFVDKDGNKVSEDNIGWELDGKAAYNIDKNLQYFIEGGVLFAGDLYDELMDSASSGTKDADTAYVVRHGIQLAF